MKKFILYLAESLFAAIIFTVLYWLMGLIGIFGSGKDFELLPTIFQGVVFGLMYVGLMKLMKKKY